MGETAIKASKIFLFSRKNLIEEINFEAGDVVDLKTVKEIVFNLSKIPGKGGDSSSFNDRKINKMKNKKGEIKK